MLLYTTYAEKVKSMLAEANNTVDDLADTARWAATITLHQRSLVADDLATQDFFKRESFRQAYSRFFNNETGRLLKELSNFEVVKDIQPEELADVSRALDLINLIRGRLMPSEHPTASRRGKLLPLLAAIGDDTWSAF
jgi:hypothetical protein